jgi:putative transposase
VGYRRVLDRLSERGVRVNHKRMERLWQEHRLGRPIQRGKRQQRRGNDGEELPKASRANERWAVDFLSDRLENGKPYRILAVVDVMTRECLTLLASPSMPASRVVAGFERIALLRGVPEMITMDNGPELISHLLRSWAQRNGVSLHYSRPGTPTDNPFIESFNARLRAECSELWWIESIDEAQDVLERWRREYNEVRGHGSLRRQTPKAFAAITPWVEYRPPAEEGPRL